MSPTPGEWRIHAGLALALAICIPLFVFEVNRALEGNTLSWAYVFEWPLFAAYAVYLWHQLLRQERGESPARRRRDDSGDEDAMAALNEYFERVHREGTDDDASGGV